jgi:hypothetical protein
MEQAQEETDGVFKAVNSQLRALNPILENARQKVEEYLDSWMPEFQKVEEAYNQALQKLGGGREQKAAERKNLLAELQGLEDKAKQYRSKDEMLPDLVKQRNELLDLLEQAYFKFFEARKIKYDQLTNLSDGKLQLNLYHSTNRQNFEVQLMDLLKGGMAAPTPSERRQIAQNIMPRRFIQLVLDRNIPHLANEAGISERTAEKVIEKLWSHDDFREVLAIQHGCFPADVPSIRFRKGPEQYDELNELSVGQKCTALLIIALCDGNMPVIIDQPEDALDIVSVWEDIAKKLRRGKISRQFILTTHNSSVAVASDSDQFIVLTAGAIRGRVDKTGAIDGKEVRQLVIKHLEGGDEPYKLRSRKYNIH